MASVPRTALTAARRKLPVPTPGIAIGFWKARNRPALGALVGLEARTSSPSSRTLPLRDLVLGMAHQRVGQRALARAVAAHQRVHLARADGQVDPAQDLTPLDGDVQVLDFEQRRAAAPRAVPLVCVMRARIHLSACGARSSSGTKCAAACCSASVISRSSRVVESSTPQDRRLHALPDAARQAHRLARARARAGSPRRCSRRARLRPRGRGRRRRR